MTENCRYVFGETKERISHCKKLIIRFDQQNFTRKYVLKIPKIVSEGVFEDCNISLIGQSAFNKMKQWEKLDFSQCKRLKTIELYAFQDCANLCEIKLPINLQKIGKYAFRNCFSLSKIELDEESDVTYVGQYAFSGTNISNFYFPPFLSTILEGAFNGILSLQSFSVDDNNMQLEVLDDVLYHVGNKCTVAYPQAKKKESISIKQGTKVIGALTFAETSINTFYIPLSVGTISNMAFYNSSIREIVFENASVLTTIQKSAFYNCQNLEIINLTNCSVLVIISKECFFNCSNLRKAIFPSSTRYIHEYSFKNCTKLSSTVFLGNSTLDYLCDQCFANTNLSVFYLPRYCNLRGSMQYSGCPITSFDIHKNNTNAKEIEGVIYGHNIELLHYYMPCINATKFVVPSTVTIIRSGCFYGCNNLKHIILHDCITDIGDYAFAKTGIIALVIPCSVGFLGINTFDSASNLSFVELAGSFKIVPRSCFRYCSSLINVRIGWNITTVRDGAFLGCNKLKCISCSDDIRNTLKKMFPKHIFSSEYCPLRNHGVYMI